MQTRTRAQMQNKSISIGQQWAQAWMQILLFAQEKFSLCQSFKFVMFLLGKLQILGFVLSPISDITGDRNIPLLNIYLKIIRPEIWLVQEFEAIRELGCHKMCIILLYISFTSTEKSQIINVLSTKSTVYQRILVSLIGLYSQLLVLFLMIPFTTLIIESVTYQLDSNQNIQINYGIMTVSIIALFILFVDIILHYQTTEDSVLLRIQGFQRFKVSTLEYCCFIIILFQCIIYATVTDIDLAKSISIFIVLIVSTLRLIAQFIDYEYILNYQILGLLISTTFNITIAILITIEQLIINQSQLMLSHFILLFPLLYYILYHINQTKLTEIGINYYSRKHFQLKQLEVHLARIINDQLNRSSHENCIIRSLAMSSHKKSCHKIDCFCQITSVYSDTTTINGLPIHSENRLLYKRIKYLRQFMGQHKTSTEDMNQSFLHQAAYLLNFGWVILSIHQINQIKQVSQGKVKPKHTDNSSLQLSKSKNSGQRQINESYSSNSSRQNSSVVSKIGELSQKQSQRNNKIISNQIRQPSFIFNAKADYLHSVAKTLVNQTFSHTQEADEQQNLSTSIQQYIWSELSISTIQTRIENIVMQKITFYISLIGSKLMNSNKLFKFTQKLSNKLQEIETTLQILYAQFPSFRVSSTICFYEAEIMNNHMEAYKYSSVSSLSDEKLLTLQKNRMNTILFDANTYYLLLSLNDDLQTFTTLNTSNNLANVYGKLPTVDQLLPQYIQQEHQLLVSRFISTGKAKFYRGFSLSFVVTQNGSVKPIHLCFDTTSQINNDNLTLAVFFKELEYDQAFILLDVNKNIGGITDSIFSRLGYSDQEICLINNLEMFNQLHISQLIPTFDELIDNTHMKFRRENVVFQFMKFTQLFHCQQIAMADDSYNQLGTLWKNNESLNCYVSTLNIMRSELYGFYYYIIEIEDIKELKPKLNETSRTFHNTFSVELSEIEALAEYPNNFDVQPHYIYAEESIYLPRFQQQKLEFGVSQQIDLDKQHQINILSPNQSMSLLIQQDKLQTSQQKFYHSSQQQMQEQQSESPQQQEVSIRVQQISMDDDRNNDHQSQASSLAGMRKSIFYKKYDVICRITVDKPSIYLNSVISMTILQIITFCLFSCIVLSLISVDLQRFIKEIDMISLHASLMGPCDMFFTMRVTITAYQQLFRSNLITQQQLDAFIDPLYQYVGLGYDDLRDNFYEQMANPYLQEFFIDDNVTVQFMKENDTQVYPVVISFRQQLQTWLMYQYLSKRTFDMRGSTKGQPYQVFQYANYFKTHNKLEKLTNEIHEYSKGRSQLVSNKWSLIWIIFAIIGFCLGHIAALLYNLYLKQYDSVLNLYKYIDNQCLQEEIDRLKILLKQIQTDPYIMYTYRFNLNDKEVLIVEQQKKLTQIQDRDCKTKVRITNVKLSRLYGFGLYFVLFALFSIYSSSVTLQTSTYLSKYQETTDIFKLFQDLRFRSGNIYLYREILMRWSNFTYLTDDDKESLYGLIDSSMFVMLQYVKIAVNMDYNKYLFSEDFINFFEETQTSPLCNYIDSNYTGFMNPYCPLAFEGVMEKGLVQSLNFIVNSIQTQRAINNFTSRAETIFYELEGSQIVTRVFFNVSEQFKNGMLQITTEHLTFVESFSITFLAFGILISIILTLHFRGYWQKEFTSIRRLVFILPSLTLFLDDTLERAMRLIIMSEQL